MDTNRRGWLKSAAGLLGIGYLIRPVQAGSAKPRDAEDPATWYGELKDRLRKSFKNGGTSGTGVVTIEKDRSKYSFQIVGETNLTSDGAYALRKDLLTPRMMGPRHRLMPTVLMYRVLPRNCVEIVWECEVKELKA